MMSSHFKNKRNLKNHTNVLVTSWFQRTKFTLIEIDRDLLQAIINKATHQNLTPKETGA